ncbi:MAG: amidohydrolase [Actinobacteria bacterium]|nr:MAG: amidohydrolase [Actinomycetota bacterium]
MRDACTRYLPEEYLDRAITTVKDADGKDVVLAGRRIATFNSEQGMGFDYAYRPGSLSQMLKEMASGDPDARYEPEPMREEYVDRAARLKLLDAQGVARCVLYPGALALSAEGYVADTDALYANLSSFNRWYDETWGFNYEDRIYATALLSLRDLDRAVELTDEILARGARVVLLPTGPAYGRGPADPYFDPVWARLAEAGVVIALHVMPFWYFDAVSPAWGLDPDPAAWHMSAWQWMNVYGERPVVDTISSLIFDNLFGRYPRLNVLISEHGASWVPHALRHMDKSRGMGRNGPWRGGTLEERPSAIFKRHVRVTPYPEDDVLAIIDQLDGDEGVLVFGSDFPHAEGVADPADFEQLLDPLPGDAVRRIMRGNAEAIFDAHA